MIEKKLSIGPNWQLNTTSPTNHTGTIRSEKFNMRNIFLVSLSYRYRVQCDRGFNLLPLSREYNKLYVAATTKRNGHEGEPSRNAKY